MNYIIFIFTFLLLAGCESKGNKTNVSSTPSSTSLRQEVSSTLNQYQGFGPKDLALSLTKLAYDKGLSFQEIKYLDNFYQLDCYVNQCQIKEK